MAPDSVAANGLLLGGNANHCPISLVKRSMRQVSDGAHRNGIVKSRLLQSRRQMNPLQTLFMGEVLRTSLGSTLSLWLCCQTDLEPLGWTLFFVVCCVLGHFEPWVIGLRGKVQWRGPAVIGTKLFLCLSSRKLFPRLLHIAKPTSPDPSA